MTRCTMYQFHNVCIPICFTQWSHIDVLRPSGETRLRINWNWCCVIEFPIQSSNSKDFTRRRWPSKIIDLGGWSAKIVWRKDLKYTGLKSSENYANSFRSSWFTSDRPHRKMPEVYLLLDSFSTLWRMFWFQRGITSPSLWSRNDDCLGH